MSIRGFLGIDAGTQGLSIVLVDSSMEVLAFGEGSYQMCPGLAEGCYEQNPGDWTEALTVAMAQLRGRMESDFEVAGIGISGQMHGEVLIGSNLAPLKAARLWCDARNEAEGHELTQTLGTKMPKRITAARWLWTLRNEPEVAAQTAHLTTPGGWLSCFLTGELNLGVGDAAGMFPIDQATMDYDEHLLQRYDQIANQAGATKSLKQMLPRVCVAGQAAGQLIPQAAQALGLPAGIPVAAAEGDQPASLAGSLIGKAGMVSVSFGTSVCANSVGDRPFQGVSEAVDHFCAPDGKPINMVWLRNGTTYMNTLVKMFGKVMTDQQGNAFAAVMPQVVQSPADCGGLLALPFMDDEPGLGISEGGRALVIGLNQDNATPGNVVKAALLATMFNLRKGCEVLDQQGFPRTEFVLTGGLTKTPELGQVLADVCNTRVTLPAEADEGCAWGAALLAKFLVDDTVTDWATFLQAQQDDSAQVFEPAPVAVKQYDQVYQRYADLVSRHA